MGSAGDAAGIPGVQAPAGGNVGAREVMVKRASIRTPW
jgi:hypothetical protein